MSTDPVGSLAEEAAKLFAAVQGWANDARQAWDDEHGDEDDGSAADAAGRPHDPLSAECRYCPLCNLARLAKAATPEVREHLASAGLSLAMAFKEMVDNVAAQQRPGSAADPDGPVERIDLED
jgi:hypothetical protein